MANFCMKCGAQLDPGAKFCAVCGQPVLSPQPQNNQQTQQVYGQAPQPQQQNYGQPGQGYGQAQQNYGQPQQSYGQPQQSYGQPQQNYGQPNSQTSLNAPAKSKAPIILMIIALILILIFLIQLAIAGFVKPGWFTLHSQETTALSCSIELPENYF